MKMERRMKVIAILIGAGLLIIVGRLVQLQIIQTENFSHRHINLIESSIAQRTKSFAVDSGRGVIVDRTGQPLNVVESHVLLLFPHMKTNEWPLQSVANIANVSVTELKQLLARATGPAVVGGAAPLLLTKQQAEQINELKLPGILAVKQQLKNEHPLAEHLIGYTGENNDLLSTRYEEKIEAGSIRLFTETGVTGLEAAFDEFLISEGEEKLLYHVDRQGNPLLGLEIKYSAPANPFYPVKVKTTIDGELQDQAERIVSAHQLNFGGLVLIDIQKSELLAMVSRPNYEDANPLKGNGAVNHMLSPQIPGSVFKLVTAAAAIEHDLISANAVFDCDLDLYGQSNAKHQQGKLSFQDSFAQSCNRTFAKLAQNVLQHDPNELNKVAEMLGLVTKVGWSGEVFHLEKFQQLHEEKNGQIWDEVNEKYEKKSPKAIAQTAIGQKNVRITPLAAANMMATIARNGASKQVKVVSDILYKNNTVLFSFPNQDLMQERLSPYTVKQLQKYLKYVVESEQGTGRFFQDAHYSISGKSGTAEVNQSSGLENKWFVGYFPSDKPRYALAVVSLSAKANQHETYPVFKAVVNATYEKDQRSRSK